MSGLAKIGASILAYGGANWLFGLLTGAHRRDVILAYHRVLPDDWRETGVPVDRSQRYVTASEFRHQLQLIARRRRPATLNDIVHGTDAPSFTVTFDDGYEDNFTIARPILRELSIPATLFVTTGVISGKDCFWWDRLADVLERSTGREFDYAGKRYHLGDVGETRDVLGDISSRIKRSQDRDDIIAGIEDQLGVTAEVPPDLYMKWEQVQALYDEGWEIGSHSSRHSILTTIPLEVASGNIDDSVKAIEEYLGAPPRYFAYPNGRPGDYDDKIIAYLKERGFVGAVTMLGGPVPEDHDVFVLPRVAPRGGETDTAFRLRLTGLYDRIKGI